MAVLVKLVKKWIAGETVNEALARTRTENSKGNYAIINYLGEDLKKEEEVEKNVQMYLKILDKIKKRDLDATISIKPTQLHISKKFEHSISHFERIISRAKKDKVFVWIDMEGSEYTDKTITSYLALHRQYKNVGMSLQANLKRSAKDLEKILKRGGYVRLVKGAYKETPDIAYQKRSEVDKNYVRLMGMLFSRGKYFVIATHDPKLISKALEMNIRLDKNFDFQFLMGIHDDIKANLSKNGRRVGSYIPFGKDWKGYISRRVKERPHDIFLAARSLVSK